MGFRTKDEVIYSRVTGNTRGEFHKQMEESGYKSSSDFIEYLLRVNKGKQVDGVTLKEFMDTMKDVQSLCVGSHSSWICFEAHQICWLYQEFVLFYC